ncbi:uncharacterized protein LOC110423107 [Herrania umbratica]|uniref:Uncharacterized protein LOC110423107 n=1 Tax=Herrania umbratica TaxID=108875 RepID=A0A6J1B0R8_9ROSI|nr:uncharacterized protein LOC110423107 [Herrania umbratica]
MEIGSSSGYLNGSILPLLDLGLEFYKWLIPMRLNGRSNSWSDIEEIFIAPDLTWLSVVFYALPNSRGQGLSAFVLELQNALMGHSSHSLYLFLQVFKHFFFTVKSLVITPVHDDFYRVFLQLAELLRKMLSSFLNSFRWFHQRSQRVALVAGKGRPQYSAKKAHTVICK